MKAKQQTAPRTSAKSNKIAYDKVTRDIEAVLEFVDYEKIG